MEEIFQIITDRLQGGVNEKIGGEAEPSFLDVQDGNLSFLEKVSIDGNAYLADNFLILCINAKTTYRAYCKICNELANFSLEMKNIYFTEELKNIPSKVYDFRERLREAMLLDIPLYHECEGNCPNRAKLKKYLRSS